MSMADILIHFIVFLVGVSVGMAGAAVALGVPRIKHRRGDLERRP